MSPGTGLQCGGLLLLLRARRGHETCSSNVHRGIRTIPLQMSVTTRNVVKHGPHDILLVVLASANPFGLSVLFVHKFSRRNLIANISVPFPLKHGGPAVTNLYDNVGIVANGRVVYCLWFLSPGVVVGGVTGAGDVVVEGVVASDIATGILRPYRAIHLVGMTGRILSSVSNMLWQL